MAATFWSVNLMSFIVVQCVCLTIIVHYILGVAPLLWLRAQNHVSTHCIRNVDPKFKDLMTFKAFAPVLTTNKNAW